MVSMLFNAFYIFISHGFTFSFIWNQRNGFLYFSTGILLDLRRLSIAGLDWFKFCWSRYLIKENRALTGLYFNEIVASLVIIILAFLPVVYFIRIILKNLQANQMIMCSCPTEATLIFTLNNNSNSLFFNPN